MERIDLNELIERNRLKCSNGRVADYIPGLSKGMADDLGVYIITNEGKEIYSGDYDKKFTIQSVSKPFILLLALMDNGIDYVFSKVGMEASGDAFNSIVRLETKKEKIPCNPMINAGAITVTSMIKGNSLSEKFERIMEFMRKISENPDLEIDEEIYLGEKDTGHRNRALAYFQKGEGLIEGNVEEILDLYFRQCSINITAKDLSRLGMVLALGGKISTGEQVVPKEYVKIVNSIILTCGMYDGSGEFAVQVGIPSKSGVGGGIVSFIPGKYGIGVFGPALDPKGNSIGGIGLLKDLSEKHEISIF